MGNLIGREVVLPYPALPIPVARVHVAGAINTAKPAEAAFVHNKLSGGNHIQVLATSAEVS